MATPTASGKPTPFTPAAASPSSHANKTVSRSPVSHMKRSRADTLRGMEYSSSQQGATPRQGSSPSFLGTPGQSHGGPGLGLYLNTPGGATPGGAAMQRGVSTSFGLSALGMDSGLLNADREAFAKARVAEMREVLLRRWGFVSRVGIQRVAASLGLECLWETGENEETGILDVAGDGVLLQIIFNGQAIHDTTLSFPVAESSGRFREPDDDRRGGAILKKDLRGWSDEQARGFYVDLGNFGANMQHMAEIDHLGKSGIRCFEAIDGVYRGLKDVEDWWRKRPGFKNALDMLAKGPGWTRIHANGKVGVRMDYWLHLWQVTQKYETEDAFATPTKREPDLYGMQIGVSPLHTNPDTFVTPVRITKDWFGFIDDIPLDDANTAAPQFPPLQLERKEPEPTYLPVAELSQSDESAIPRLLPSVMFKASFDPPLPISYAASTALLGQHGEVPRSYASLLFDDTTIDLQRPDATVLLEREAHHPPSDSTKRVLFSVSSANALPAYLLRELPFSHPIDLLNMLPVLRQWAWLHKLVLKSLGQPTRLSIKPEGSSTTNVSRKPNGKVKEKKKLTAKEVRAILKAGGTWAPPSDTESDDDEPSAKSQDEYNETVDISLEIPEPTMGADGNPTPSTALNLRLSVPVGEGKDPVMVQLALAPGPSVTVSPTVEAEGASSEIVKKIVKILENAGDAAMMVMWLRDQADKDALGGGEREQQQGGTDEEMKDA